MDRKSGIGGIGISSEGSESGAGRLYLSHSRHLQMTDVCDLNRPHYWWKADRQLCSLPHVAVGLCCVNSGESSAYLRFNTSPVVGTTLTCYYSHVEGSCSKQSEDPSAVLRPRRSNFRLNVCAPDFYSDSHLTRQDPAQTGISPTVPGETVSLHTAVSFSRCVGCVKVLPGAVKHISHVCCLFCE